MTQMVSVNEQLLRLLLATLAGMAVGLERERKEKAAGFRTLSLVSLGAAIFTMLAYYLPLELRSLHLAAGVVTGVGFLGAGVIMRQHRAVTGLTTAAAVWASAALGMSAGFGAYWLTGAGTVGVLLVLLTFPALNISGYAEETRTYQIECPLEPGLLADVARQIAETGMRHHRVAVQRGGGCIRTTWEVVGRPAEQGRLAEALLADGRLERVEVE